MSLFLGTLPINLTREGRTFPNNPAELTCICRVTEPFITALSLYPTPLGADVRSNSDLMVSGVREAGKPSHVRQLKVLRRRKRASVSKACRYKKKHSAKVTCHGGQTGSGLCRQCVVKGPIWRGRWGLEEGGGIYSSRERKVTV